MGITFRHDAAAVALPTTNASGRKYGQQLVLQQQQQKYATQQAQQDRMFDAYKMDAQNQVQQQRDWQQRDFVLNRDRDQNKLQQQQMEAARQQQFMDDARKMQSGMIMADIQNGEYDPNTARKLQQNLVAESEALGNPQLDATQRAEALQKIRAERALLASNRMQKPPAPTPQEQFEQGVVNRNGVDYIQDSKGKWTPLEPSKAQQEQEKQQQQQMQQQEQEAQKMRPKSAQEYYSENEDKFQKDLDSTMKSMQSEYDDGTRKEAPTPEAAWEQMQKNHDFKQKALGKAQYGEPTLAKPYGQALGEARQATEDKVKGGYESYSALADMNDKLLELENRANSFPKGSKEASAAWSQYRKERDRIINGDIQPAPEMRSILEQPGQQKIPATPMPGQPVPTAPSAPSPAQPAPSPPVAVTPPSPAQNAWAQVATPPATPTPAAPGPAPTEQGLVDMGPAYTGQLDASGIPTEDPVVTNRTMNTPPRSKTPDFGSLASNATDNTDKVVISKLQGIYSTAKPEVQSAIGVLVNPGVTDSERASAARYLREAGIDIEKLLDTPKQTSKPVSPRDPKNKNYYPKTSKPVSPRDPKNKNYYPKTSKPGS